VGLAFHAANHATGPAKVDLRMARPMRQGHKLADFYSAIYYYGGATPSPFACRATIIARHYQGAAVSLCQ